MSMYAAAITNALLNGQATVNDIAKFADINPKRISTGIRAMIDARKVCILRERRGGTPAIYGLWEQQRYSGPERTAHANGTSLPVAPWEVTQ